MVTAVLGAVLLWLLSVPMYIPCSSALTAVSDIALSLDASICSCLCIEHLFCALDSCVACFSVTDFPGVVGVFPAI